MPRERDYSRLVMAAEPKPFWLDRPDAPAVRERLSGEAACDLAVIGGGFTGLWTALLFKELYPERSVVLVEGNRVGWAASGRNGPAGGTCGCGPWTQPGWVSTPKPAHKGGQWRVPTGPRSR